MTSPVSSLRTVEVAHVEPTRVPVRFPRWGVFGLALIAVGWITAWLPTHPLSAVSFVLLWVGLTFTLDALVLLRRGGSLWRDHRAKFAQLFAFSVPFWWLFEALNARVQNWHYVLDHPYGLSWNPLTYNIMATLCFSTVLPAVMEMAALVTSLRAFQPRIAPYAEPRVPRRWIALEAALGIITLAAPLIWPHYAFGLIWLGPLLLLDPINAALGRRSVIAHVVAWDWRFPISIALATLGCGFIWEMWNFWSLPKWQYTVPFIGFAKLFEMPALGYIGYLPFGLELFALYHFLLLLTRQKDDALPF